jgi:hypothetical protein
MSTIGPPAGGDGGVQQRTPAPDEVSARMSEFLFVISLMRIFATTLFACARTQTGFLMLLLCDSQAKAKGRKIFLVTFPLMVSPTPTNLWCQAALSGLCPPLH